MVTWQQNQKYYESTFDVLHSYLNSKMKGVAMDTMLKRLSTQMVEKIHINLITCIDMIPMVEKNPMKFLSYGLVLRGMVSDLINYHYLRQVYEIAGKDILENEVKVLDLDFVEAYKSFLESEKKMAGADAATAKAMEDKFKETFKDFYNADQLIKKNDLRTDEMMKPLKDFVAAQKLDNNINFGTEAGKLKFILDNNIEQLKITYKYLSQLQHFSTTAYLFYKMKEYQEFNPYFSLLIIFITIKALVPISKDLAPDDEVVERFVGLAAEIAKLTE